MEGDGRFIDKHALRLFTIFQSENRTLHLVTGKKELQAGGEIAPAELQQSAPVPETKKSISSQEKNITGSAGATPKITSRKVSKSSGPSPGFCLQDRKQSRGKAGHQELKQQGIIEKNLSRQHAGTSGSLAVLDRMPQARKRSRLGRMQVELCLLHESRCRHLWAFICNQHYFVAPGAAQHEKFGCRIVGDVKPAGQLAQRAARRQLHLLQGRRQTGLLQGRQRQAQPSRQPLESQVCFAMPQSRYSTST